MEHSSWIEECYGFDDYVLRKTLDLWVVRVKGRKGGWKGHGRGKLRKKA